MRTPPAYYKTALMGTPARPHNQSRHPFPSREITKMTMGSLEKRVQDSVTIHTQRALKGLLSCNEFGSSPAASAGEFRSLLSRKLQTAGRGGIFCILRG